MAARLEFRSDGATMTAPERGLLLGRDREVHDIAGLLDRACDGQGGAVILRGEAGIGKTTLLRQAESLSARRGMRTLRCNGVPAEARLPFAALHQLVRPVLDHLSSVPAHHAQSLRGALGSEEPEGVDLYRAALATLELLASAAADEPLLILADDAHWMDRPTTDVLAFVGRRIASEPIALVVGIRVGAEDRFAGRDLSHLVLEPLDREASADLLSHVAPDLAGDLRRRVLRDAGGNPLALEELPSTAHMRSLTPDRMAVGDLLKRSFAARSLALPDATRALLLVAAAETQCSLGQLCAAATRIHADDVSVADLQPALDARLIGLADGKVVFCHPVMASAIYQTASVDQRLRAHNALSEVVVDDDRRAWHRAAGTVDYDDALAEEMQSLADRASRRGAVSISISLLEGAAALMSRRTHAADTLLRAAEQAVELGHRGLAEDLVTRAETNHLSPIGRSRLMIVDDALRPLEADAPMTVRDLVDTAFAARDAGDSALALSLLWTSARRCYWTDAPSKDRAVIDAATRALALPDDDPRRIALLVYAGLPDERASLQRRIRSLTGRVDDPFSLGLLGSAALNLNDHGQAVRMLSAAASVARRRGQLGTIPRLQAMRAWSTLWTGTMDSVTAEVGEAERLADELDQPPWHGAAVLLQANVVGLRGDLAQALELAAPALSSPDVRGVRLFAAMTLYSLGIAAIGIGDHQQAYELLRRTVDPGDASSHYAAREWVAGDLVEAALRSGHLADCAELLDDLDGDWDRGPSDVTLTKIRYGKALLGPAESAGERFAALLNSSSDDDALMRGRILLEYGSWLRRRRRNREARTMLAEACEVFARLGVDGFGRRAGRELRAAGGTASPRRGVGLSGLTPQELQIAQLAAEGLSNRQIAEQLFLSHRTVGSHLYRTFPKLGVTSRSELAGVLDRS